MKMLKQSLSIFVSFSLFVNQCLYAADLPIEVDTTAAAKHQASLDKAPNGVQIVNIVNPNAQGMSHNKFKEYNVNSSGLILNNSKTVVNTQLAGYISYNPNLTNNASVILNEVTGTNKSLLKGYSEVAGVKADVIVANPNGITVNGGGFINTNKATLTTGTPTFLNGFVNGFDISKGQILIEGDGFNVNNINKVELYSKALQINAKFYADNLKVATGDNFVDLNGNVTSNETLGSGVSIDSSLLGGIYANRIELISSDKGVGVNLPPEVFAQDTLSLRANGDIVLEKTIANNRIDIISTNGNINNSSTLSTNDLILNAKENLTNTGIIESNNATIDSKLLENKNSIYAMNDVTLNTQTLNNSGLIQADDDIKIVSDIVINNIDSTIYAKNDSDITTNVLNNNGLFISENLNINAKTIDNNGALYTTKDMTVNAQYLTNHEMIRSNNEINLLIENELKNSSSGVIYGDGNINISSNSAKDKINTVINEGLIQSNKNINITAKKLENTATTPTYKNSTTSSSQTISRGGGNDYDIVTTTVNTQAIDIPSDPALILSEGNINIDVETLNNFYSLIASNQDITLNANDANNVGKILVSTTTVRTAQYRDERYCSSSGPSGVCFNHKNRAAYRGTFTTAKTTKLPVPNYGIQAKRSITGNVVNLNNTNGSAQDILTNQEISAKQETASIIETNAISLQKLTDQLDTNNENKTNALGSVPDMNALIDSIQTQDDFLAFKTDLYNLESSIQSSIDQDKLDISSIEAVIAYTKNLTITDTLSTEITNLEVALQTLKDNVSLNESNITTFKSVNDSILTIDDITLNKQALIDIDKEVRTVVSDNLSLISTLNTSGSVNTIVFELEGISNTLYDEVKQSLDLQTATTKTLLSDNDGLYQTNNTTTLESVNNVSYDNKVLTTSDVINFDVILPTGKYGLFVLNERANHPYLIESNPLYTSYDKFIGSDYMLGKLNYKPEDTIQRLGDGLYETTFVRDSIIKLSGQRYLDGFSSDVSQFQSLMDNALSLKDDLKLSYGVTLSKEQIAQLNKDIVWMEERIVDNKKVLVPIVYLATINQENMLDGAKIIAGEHLILTAQNDVTNQGLISSNNDTNIQANNIINQGGTINSKENISLNAINNIENISGNIQAKNDIELLAQNNIKAQTYQNQKTYNYGSGYETVTNKGKASTIEAGGNVTLTAQNDVTLTGVKVKSDKDITLVSTNKDVSINSLQMNEDYNFNFYNGYNKGKNIRNIGSSVDANNITVQAKTLNVKSSDLNATENISLNGVEDVNVTATNDLTYQDTQIKSKGFLSKKTQRDMKYKETVVSSNLTAKNILINSDKDVTLEAAKLKANENIIVDAKGDVNVVAKQYKEGELHQTSKSSFGGLVSSASMDRKDSLKLNSAELSAIGQNIVFKSGDSVKVLASKLSAQNGGISIDAANDILISAGKELNLEEKWTKKSSFLKGGAIMSSQFDLKGQGSTTGVSTELNSKDLTLNSGNDTTVLGSDLNTSGNTSITTGGEFSQASIEEVFYQYEEHKKTSLKFNLKAAQQFAKGLLDQMKKNHTPKGLVQSNKDAFGTIDPGISIIGGNTSINIFKAEVEKSASNNKDTIQKASNINSDGSVDINSNKGINIASSTINANGDINLKANEDINIHTLNNQNENNNKDLKADVYIGFNSNGVDLEAEYTKSDLNNFSTTAKASEVNTNSNLTIDGNNALVEGSDINVGKNLTVNVKNDFNVIASTNSSGKSTKTFDAKSTSGGDTKMKLKDGKIVMDLGEASVDKVKKQVDETTKTSSNINVGENINVNSGNDILVEGSNLKANEDINLTANNNVDIKEAKEEVYTNSEEFHGKAVVSVEVKHQAIEIVKAVKALNDAKNKAKQAKNDYEQYKSDLANLEEQLTTLKTEYDNKTPGITKADIEEFKSIIQDVKSDESWYKKSIVLADANVAMQSLFLVQQIKGLASSLSSYAWGFDAGINLNIDTILQKANVYASSSVASNISAKNINIQANNQANIQGSNLYANNDINLKAKEVNLLASSDKSSQEQKSDHVNLNYNYSLYAGATYTASYDRAKFNEANTTYTNSNVAGNNININSNEDTNVKGANVNAKDTLNLDVGNDLNVVSVQNRQRSDSKSMGINFSNSSVGFSTGKSRSNQKETQVSSIIGNEVNVAVNNETYLQGATIASLDENGNDNNNLTIKTKTLKYDDLSNTSYANNKSTGGSVSFSTKTNDNGEKETSATSSSIQYSNNLTLSKDKTLSTVGKGNLEVANLDESSDLERLNRDVSDTTKDIYDVNRQMGNVDITVDNRVFTEDGRKQIKQEYEEMNKNMNIIAGTLPDANSDNKIEATVGEVWNKLTKYLSLGLIPSNENRGGVLAEIPILTGQEDSAHKKLLVVNELSKKFNENDYIKMEESSYYKALTAEDKKQFEGKGLYVSKVAVEITTQTATYQNSINGMMNNEAEAIKNGLEQTGQFGTNKPVELTVGYNPSYGMISDLLESAVDKSGIGTTGIAKQIGGFVNDVTTERGDIGSNFAMHSQGNAIVYNGIKYVQTTTGFQPVGYYKANNKDEPNVPTFVSFGSPMNGEDMSKLIGKDGLGYGYSGAYTKPNDFVGEVLGGNSGNNGQATLLQQINILNAYKLFTSDSPHSTYVCQDYAGQGGIGVQCGYKK